MTTDPNITPVPDPAPESAPAETAVQDPAQDAPQVAQQEFAGAAEATVVPADGATAPDAAPEPEVDIAQATGILYVPPNADEQPFREDR